MNFLHIALGAGFGLVILALFRFARVHREHGTYAVLLAMIAVIYPVLALHEGDASLSRLHIGIAAAFAACALIGARLNLWIVAAGLAAHGVFDLAMHSEAIASPAAAWYVSACAGVDLAVAAGLAGFLLQGQSPSDMT